MSEKPSDELRRIYEGKGALDRFYEGSTPNHELFRARPMGDSTDLMQPVVVGFFKRGGTAERPPDVGLTETATENSPQYTEQNELVTEHRKTRPLTQEIINNADKYTVKGCRTMHGRHRGVSLFDRTNPRLRNHDWFRIPANTKLDAALAVTRDSDLEAGKGKLPIHFTVAPKDDMPLSLFLQYLKALARFVQPV